MVTNVDGTLVPFKTRIIKFGQAVNSMKLHVVALSGMKFLNQQEFFEKMVFSKNNQFFEKTVKY